MSDYVQCKLSLRRKLESKCKRKLLKSADLPADSVPDEASGIELSLSDVPISVSSPSISDVEFDNKVSKRLTNVRDSLFSKISDMFRSFASQVDSRFKCID